MVSPDHCGIGYCHLLWHFTLSLQHHTLKCKGQVAKSITSHFVLWALACITDKQCLISWRGWRWVRASDTFVKYGTYRQVTSMAKNLALWNSFWRNIGYAKISPLYIFRPLKKKSTIHMKEALDNRFFFLLLLNQTHTNLWEEIHVYTQQFPHLLHPTCWPALKSLLLHSIGSHHTSLFLRSTKVNNLNMAVVNWSTLDCRTVHTNTQTLTVKILSLPDLSYIWVCM